LPTSFFLALPAASGDSLQCNRRPKASGLTEAIIAGQCQAQVNCR